MLFKKLLRNYLAHHHQSVVGFGIRGLSILIGFCITYFIGHRFGAIANGQYALVTQTTMFLSIIAIGGLDIAIVKEFSAAMARNLSLNRKMVINVLAASSIIAAGLALIAMFISKEIAGGMELSGLPIAAFLMLPVLTVARALTRLTSAVLRSQHKYIWGQSVEVLLIPAIVIVPFLTHGFSTIDDVIIGTAAASAFSALVGVIGSMRYTRGGREVLVVPVRKLFATALPLWGVAVALNVADWYSLTTVATTLGLREAGIYRVALQIGTSLTLVSLGIMSVLSGQIGAAYHANDWHKIALYNRNAARISAIMTVPAALVIFFAAPALLSSIGPEFVSGVTALRLLLIGQVLYVITGPAGLTLAMMGHGRTNFLITTISTGLLFVFAPLTAHFFGIVGVVITVSTLLVGRNLTSFAVLLSREGINSMTGHVRPGRAPHSGHDNEIPETAEIELPV